MKKVVALAAVLVIAACGKKDEVTPAADNAAAPAVDSMSSMDSMPGMAHDSMMARDSAH